MLNFQSLQLSDAMLCTRTVAALEIRTVALCVRKVELHASLLVALQSRKDTSVLFCQLSKYLMTIETI